MVDAAAIKMDALLPGKRQSKQPRRFCIAFDRQPVRLVPVGLIIFNEAHKMAYNKWVSLWYCIFTAYVTLTFACTVKTDRQPNENLARKTAKLWIGIWNSWIRNWRPLRARTEKLITQPDSFNKIIFLIINFARVFSFYYAVCTGEAHGAAVGLPAWPGSHRSLLYSNDRTGERDRRASGRFYTTPLCIECLLSSTHPMRLTSPFESPMR